MTKRAFSVELSEAKFQVITQTNTIGWAYRTGKTYVNIK